MRGNQRLESILSKWRMKHYSIAIITIVIAICIGLVISNFISLDRTPTIITAILFSLLLFTIYFIKRPQHDQLVSLVNQKIIDAEHSTHLLSKTEEELTTLQRLQKAKVQDAILNNNLKLPLQSKSIYYGASLAGLCLLALCSFSNNEVVESDRSTIKTTESDQIIPENIVKPDTIRVNDVSANISPPVYTNLKSSYTKNLSLSIPEGSSVNWHFDITGNPDRKEIIFEDKLSVYLNASNNHQQTFDQSSFYNYIISKEGQNEIVSEYYPINVIEDQNPTIEISGVEEYQRLEFADNHNINFNIKTTDDYGLTNMFVSATLAKGTGEAVKFREKQTSLEDLKENSKDYLGSFAFSTKELGMEPGDELYFYVAAKDNCPYENHWSKSTTYFVVLEDTAQVTLVDAGGMQMDLMPDFFRSQRQIIIDTEKLIAERDTLPVDIFKQRSNELGYDQKLLRLKYGQFLGEESESGLDFENDIDMDLEEEHDHNDPNHVHGDDGSKALNDARSLIEQFMHDHDHEEEENQLLETKGVEKVEQAKNPEWVKDMSHSHDNTEEATFFDVSIKGKLRAALNEMWDAELHLRLFDPEQSLPYQYKSLNFLDEVKNHARAYVQRIGFDPPVIKEQEKRLTAELKEVYSTRDILTAEVDHQFFHLKASLPIILSLKQNPNKDISAKDELALRQGANELSAIALSESEYLPILSLMRSLVSKANQLSSDNFDLLIKGISQILPDKKKDVVGDRYYRHPINMKVISKFKKAL